ncbi:hypothetical protein ACEWY4_005572 [Coilia grayii]|uniref:MAX gene-associated protein-like n=1 Tax=Coilia grayii TaxID=363190 RepID=A0ABD1KJ25_9TELE
MAEKKQTVMVLREDGATAPAVAPTSAATSSFFVDLRSGQTMEGGNALGAQEANGEADAATKAIIGLVAASPHAVTSTLSSDSSSNHHPENLPPEATSKGITVTLDNNNMWNEFFRCKTEMILTKQGRRMFPSCRYRISGMEPFQRYLLVMDIIPMDNHRYKWSDHRWEPNGKSEAHIPGRVFIHQESPASGHYWMQSPVSFYKLKLTNNAMDQDGHIVLHSMHRYLPRLHILPADKPTDVIDVDAPDVMTFSFPQTEFFAVTAYQNLSITQLKIDYNPFAKGFREDAANSRSLAPKLGSPNIAIGSESKNSKELGPITNSLKALFAKRVPVEKNNKEQELPAMKDGEVDRTERNAQLSVVTDKSTVKRRPSTLSELFQGTPLKLRKMGPETSGPSVTSQKNNSGSVNAGRILDPDKALQNPEQLKSVVKEDPTANVKSEENFGSTSDVPISVCVQSSVTQKNGEKGRNISTEDTASDIRVDDSEQSQNKSAPQKRAGAKALPLLALFFQQLKSKPKPVKTAPKPDVSGSDGAPEESASPTTNIAVMPSTTHRTESSTQLIDIHTSTLTPVVSIKAVENIGFEAPSELLTSPQTSDVASKKLSEMQTFSQPPAAHTSPQSTTVLSKPDTTLTTKPDEAKPQSVTTSASGDPVNQRATLVALSPLLPSQATPAASQPGSPSSTEFWPCSPAPLSDREPLDPPSHITDIPPVSEQEEDDDTGDNSGTGVASLVINSSNQLSTGKAKARPRKKGRKNKQLEEEPVVGGPTDVRMQPNLEDVEGQLFVSFTSKEALHIHLGDHAEEAQPPPQKSPEVVEKKVDESPECMAERIASLEKALLQDLKVMKYKQVIHPVLQEVGLKLNILDQILAIDLVYLGVELPIPPPSQCPGSSSGSVSSQLQFVSRTGKTTDVTKIKGWREKFVTPDSKELQPEAGTSSDLAMKNRSAFCSDMLDEYLASEGKLIDERVASFSTSSVTPVAYQMPTKSSSYVRTLDSVLKKRGPAPVPSTTTTTTTAGSSATPVSKQSTLASQTKKSKAPSKPKEPQKLNSSAGRRSSRTANPKGTPETTRSSTTSETQKAPSLPSKTSTPKLKNSTKNPPAVKPAASEISSAKASVKVETKPVTQAGSSICGRNVNLPPTVVKLLEVEDGAVWEGKERTYVTEERASIALAALATATGVILNSTPSLPIIKRRAPPCLSAHCRLGCVCTSLALERRHHHCGKPECMLGCHCLRHKVVLRRKSEEGDVTEANSPSSQNATENEEGLIKSKRKKKKKKRRSSVAYVLTDPQVTSEPATRVKTLWNGEGTDTDQDMLHIPTPVTLPCPLRYDIQQGLKNEHDSLHDENMMTCARVRPFEAKALKAPQKKDENISMDSADESGQGDEPEPGEYTHGPSKRLEVVSECKWERRADRTYIMRVLCQHMDKDRLKTPFWIGKYRIQPISQTVVDEGQGPCTNYKVRISQPQLGLMKDKIQTGPETKPPDPPVAVARPKPEQQRPAPPPKARPKPRSEPKPEPKVVPAPEPKPIELLPPLRPEEGLPFLAGVPQAGLLIAQSTDEEGCGITVNGKLYPKARLQLGHMGALHPANRLAAYLTGRLDPANLPGYTKARLQAATTTTVPRTSTGSVAVVTVVNTTRTTTTTTNLASSNVKVTKPSVGKVYTQFVVNQLCSQQHKLPCAGSTPVSGSVVQKVVLSSNPLVVVGQQVAAQAQSSDKAQAGGAKGSILVTVSPKQAPQKGPVGTQVTSPVTTSVTTTTATSGGSTGGSPQIQTVLKILARQQTVALGPPAVTPGGPPTVRPKSIVGQSVGQLLLQQVRTRSGMTLYRNPNGQLVQLVPLSQLRNLKHNIVIRDQKAYVRLPSPLHQGPSPAPKDGSSIPTNAPAGTTVSTTPTSSSSVTPVSSERPVTTSAGIETTASTSTTSTTTTSTTASTSTGPSKILKIMPLPGSSALNIKTTTQVLKAAPEFLGETGTHTVRIMPTSSGAQGSPLAQGASKMVPTSGGFTLLQPPGKKLPSTALGPNIISVSPVSDRAPLMLFIDKPKIIGKDPLLGKPSPVPGVDKPALVVLADESKVVCDKDKPTAISGPSAVCVLDNFSAVQKEAHKSQHVPAANIPTTPPKIVIPQKVSPLPVTGSCSSFVSTAVTSDSSPALPVSDKSTGGLLDKPPGAPVLGRSTATSVQDKQERSGAGLAEEGSVPPSDQSYTGDSAVTSPEVADQSKPHSPSKHTPPGDGTTHSVGTLEENSHLSKPSTSNQSQTNKTVTSDETSILNKALDLAPLSPDVCEVEVDVGDDEDDECVIVQEKKSAMEEGEVGSDVEFLGDTVVLTDDSDMDSDDESICVISDSGETDVSDDNTVDIETVDDSTASFRRFNKKDRGSSEVNLDGHGDRRREGHNYNERLRRNAMRDSFWKMNVVLNLNDPKASKVSIIQEATKTIQQLETQGFYLQHKKIALAKKQKKYLKRIAQASGKSEEMVLKKLQDISSRQKIVEQQRKRKQLFSELSLPEELTVLPPVPSSDPTPGPAPPVTAGPANVEPCPKRQTTQQPTSPLTHRVSSVVPPPEKRMKVLPNILCRSSRAVPPPAPPPVPPPVPVQVPPPVPLQVPTSVFSIINPMLPGQQIVTLDNPLRSLVPIVPLSSLAGQKSLTPGVAAVTIRVPVLPKVVHAEGSHCQKADGTDQPPDEDKAAGRLMFKPLKLEKVYKQHSGPYHATAHCAFVTCTWCHYYSVPAHGSGTKSRHATSRVCQRKEEVWSAGQSVPDAIIRMQKLNPPVTNKTLVCHLLRIAEKLFYGRTTLWDITRGTPLLMSRC